MRCLFCLALLLSLTRAAGATQADAVKKASSQARQQSDRLIVRFADPRGERAERELLDQKVRELNAKAGVRHAKAYAHVGMAVVACDSFETVERLVQELDADPMVELATPDTMVSLFDGGSSDRRAARSLAETPLVEARQCSAQPKCAGLAGSCCPASDGLMLACCEPSKHNVVAFRSFHGKYMVAEESGAANSNREKMQAWEKFRLYHNDDGTISLLGFFGKYLSAQDGGQVNSNSPLIGRHEKFHLIRNNDSTVSLKTTGLPAKYLRADADGRLTADGRAINSTEKFRMIRVEVDVQLLPNDANFSALWGMDDPVNDQDIDAPEAWKAFQGAPGGSGVVVAVIDTGIDYTHEDLRDAMWTNPNEIPGNGIDDDGNGFIDDVHGVDFANEDGDPMDDQLHGTHCAGTIAGVGDNGKGVAGVSWHGVRLMALKFLTSTGSGRSSDAVKAIDYAVAHGAKILSNSWGGSASSAALRIAIERAEASGVLFVAAAGNSGTNNDEEPQYPANYPSANVVAVASTNPEGKLSGFSCYGAERVDVAAPGSGIFSTIPKNGYKFLSGTSMATPHVSGLAALVWMYRPKLSMEQVRDIVLSSVVHSDSLKGKIVTGGRINARKALDAASSVEPPYPPQHAPVAVAFQDVDSKVGVLQGIVTITAAADESDVDYYKVYFVSRAGFQLDAIGNVSATGAKSLALNLASTPVPDNAASIVAVAGNSTGESPARLGAGGPSAKLEDYGMPEVGAAAVEWHGDVDLRPGMVSGKLSIKRASDERTITNYNVYWSNSSGAHGPLVGTIPAIGFQGPRCAGSACDLINVTKTADGARYNRGNYTDHERAAITASGPGLVKLTRFDTEAFFDVLNVGGTPVHGRPPMPMEIPFPAGKVLIAWASDESAVRGGWTFELTQAETTAEFQLRASKPLGRGLLVVPAYRTTELPQGLFVELPDFTKGMPPSPGFVPSSVNFTDSNTAAGIIAGTAKVVPAPGAVGAGSVTYYQLDFVGCDGAPIGEGLRVEANGSNPVNISIAAGALPKQASKLVVRAGNSFGLGEGRASVALVDVVEPRVGGGAATPAIVRAPLLQAAHIVEPEASTPLREQEVEPWLRQPAVKREKRLVWPSSKASIPSAGSPGGHILSSVTVRGLDAEVAATPVIRAAFERLLAEGLPSVEFPDVHVSRVFALGGSGGVEVEFQVGLPQSASASSLDRIESHITLYSLGGSNAKRFERALLAALAAAGARLPEGARASVAGPRQVNPRREGRKLAAAGSARRLQSGVLADAGASVGQAAIAACALVPALGALAALAVAGRRPCGSRLRLQCGRRSPGATLGSAAAELESGLQ